LTLKEGMQRPRTIGSESDPDYGATEWRRVRLLRAGVPAELAHSVARDSRFDVHALLELLDRGCEPELAVRILAPLEEVAPQ
jgi:hypothetical protein